MKIMTGKQTRARRILLYGPHKIGKSTWASKAPGVLFADIEDGLNDLDVAKTEHLKSYADVVSCVSWLVSNSHPYQTFVIDTVDWLEQLIFQQVARDASKGNIADIGYGKGYDAARAKWDFLLGGLNALRAKNVTIILLGHAKVTRFDNPETDAYDRYDVDLHKSSCGMIEEWCDEILFASRRVFVRTQDLGFNKERKIAAGDGERYIRTTETPAAIAGNRLGLPAELPMEWDAYAKFLPPANVAGVVVNGSSKVA